MQVGDWVFIRSEYEQGHIDSYQIVKPYNSDGASYDFWLEMSTWKGQNTYLPFRRNELMLCEHNEAEKRARQQKAGRLHERIAALQKELKELGND